MPDPVKAYQCRHLFADGHRCGSKSLRGEHFCFYHHATRKPIPRTRPENLAEATFDLPYPEDRPSIQLAIGEILRRIALNQIDPRRAGLLLYGLQIASCNLPKPSRAPEEHEPTVEDLEVHPELGPLAPEAEYVPFIEKPSSLDGLFKELGLDEVDEISPPPAPTTNPYADFLPTLQATSAPPPTCNPTKPDSWCPKGDLNPHEVALGGF